jgi:hypothetical protein
MSDSSRRPYQGGLFSPPIFNCTGDPYDAKKQPRSKTANGKVETEGHFRVSKEWTPKFIRVFEGEGYRTLAKMQSEERLKGKEKFMNSSGFRFPSPSKKNSCPGAFDATFRKTPIPYVPPVIERRGRRAKVEPVIQRQVTTQPMKKPSGYGAAAVTPNAMFSPFVYESSPFDAAHEAEKVHSVTSIRSIPEYNHICYNIVFNMFQKRQEEARTHNEGRPAFKVPASVQVVSLPPSPIVARLQSPPSGHPSVSQS